MNARKGRFALAALLSGGLLAAGLLLAQRPIPTKEEFTARATEMSRRAEERGLAEPFVGVTIDGTPQRGLYSIRSTGVSTEPVVRAAEVFLASLTETQRAATTFPVDDPEWRNWMNQHFYRPQGVSFDEMSEAQREAAFGLLGASLSAKGLQLSQDIMKLNHTLGELAGNNFVEYGRWFYWITVMGQPSMIEPWGWQVDGHHLNINYFVLGSQVVMSPVFAGSEPVIATSGKFEGTAVLQEEQDKGLELVNALDEEQRARAILQSEKGRAHNVGEAFRDNVVLDYAGVRADELDEAQRTKLLELVALYVGNLREGHAELKMEEVEAHLDQTHFAWIGETGPDAVFYYRIHSPVVLIEFDHQGPVGLQHLHPAGAMREHIHTVVRTPNGNDYGKDLLRQHYETQPH